MLQAHEVSPFGSIQPDMLDLESFRPGVCPAMTSAPPLQVELTLDRGVVCSRP